MEVGCAGGDGERVAAGEGRGGAGVAAKYTHTHNTPQHTQHTQHAHSHTHTRARAHEVLVRDLVAVILQVSRALVRIWSPSLRRCLPEKERQQVARSLSGREVGRDARRLVVVGRPGERSRSGVWCASGLVRIWSSGLP